MREVPAFGIEARTWNVVFHRRAENRFFSAIAMGHFKHVSAFAWLPEMAIWVFYDVGFRRTRIVHMADGVHAQAAIAALVDGNCLVTIDARNDALPLMRAGFFCTIAVKHLIGCRSSALRPDRLYRHLVAQGGTVRDAGSRPSENRDRSEPGRGTGAGAADAHHRTADADAA